jgi:hypothetical protein
MICGLTSPKLSGLPPLHLKNIHHKCEGLAFALEELAGESSILKAPGQDRISSRISAVPIRESPVEFRK